MSVYCLDLPWTRPPMSMNDRSHWARRSAQVRDIRQTISILAANARLPRGVDHVTVQLEYRPRDNRRRDTDNLVASLKPICDELAAGTRTHPGYGMVPDDTPRWMAKPEPIIHPAIKGQPGELWLTVTVRAAIPAAPVARSGDRTIPEPIPSPLNPQNGEQP